MVGLLGMYLDLCFHKLANDCVVESQEKFAVLSTSTPIMESCLGWTWSGQR